MLAAHAGIIAIEPDVHAVALPGTASGQVLSSRPAVANGHAPPAKKAAPSRTVSSSSQTTTPDCHGHVIAVQLLFNHRRIIQGIT